MKNLLFPISSITCYLLSVLCCLFSASCTRPATPKQYGYFRISLPPHEYINVQRSTFNAQRSTLNYQLSTAADILPLDSPGWFNIHYPSLNATIYCSYMPVHNNLKMLIDDSEEFVYSHTVKASAIPEQAYDDPINHVHGVYYELEGNTATPVQFWVTDSINHFFRASVYIDCIPNQDSLAPVIDYLKTDCRVLIESLRWQ